MRNHTIHFTKFSRLTVSLVLLLGLVSLTPLLGHAATGPCAAPSTDYGTVTNTVSITGTGTYRIWSRVAIPSAVSSAYSIEVDGANCFAVSGSGLPTFAAGATTFFANSTANWSGSAVGGSPITLSLSTGSHTLRLIGTSDNVVVDRLILTQDTACIPTGVGTNCSAPPDTTAPVVSVTSPTAGAVLATTTTVSATATDDTAVSRVDFYIDATKFGTDSTASGTTYSAALSSTGLSAGAHTLKAIAYDAAGNNTTSSTVSVTAPSGGTGTPTYNVADINQDGTVNYLDLSALASAYGKSGAAITPARADLNADSTVNYLDLSILGVNYGK